MTQPTRSDIDLLTEPTRSIALEALRRLLDAGYEADRAAEVAFRQAEEWETSRLRAARSPAEPPRVAEVRLAKPGAEQDSEAEDDSS
jgi:hypothetical protein